MVNFIAQYPPAKQRYCATCDTLVEYTESPYTDRGRNGFKQFCTMCGTCVGMRYVVDYPKKGYADPYRYHDSYLRHHRNGW